MKTRSLFLISLAMHAMLFRAGSSAEEGPSIRPFLIQVDESILVDLRQRLANTRWPHQIEDTGWDYGIDVAIMKELVEYWRMADDVRKFFRRVREAPVEGGDK